MSWAGLLQALANFGTKLLEHFRDKRLKDSGRNEAQLEGLKNVEEIKEIARIARDSVSAIPDDVRLFPTPDPTDPTDRAKKRKANPVSKPSKPKP